MTEDVRSAQIHQAYDALEDELPGYLVTMLKLFCLRELMGDSMHQELEALIKGLDEDGELEEGVADSALLLIEGLPLPTTP